MDALIGDEPYNLGSGRPYRHPFVLFYKDATPEDGQGYRLWTTKQRQLHELYADVDIVGKPQEAPRR